MKIYVLTGYNGNLLDPILSFSYEEIVKKMEDQYHEALKDIKQTPDEKECTWLSANSATAVVCGEWCEWQITKLDLPKCYGNSNSFSNPILYLISNMIK